MLQKSILQRHIRNKQLLRELLSYFTPRLSGETSARRTACLRL
jgi:hypothetical protein